MSTKTTFKRVAAVAAAALTIAGVSAVSAHAAPTFNGGDTTESYVTGTYHAITFASGSADKLFTITTAGVGSVFYPATGLTSSTISASNATTELWSKGTGAIGAASAGSFGENLVGSVYSATAGTQTITITGDTSAAVTLTITWGAAQTVSASNSTAVLNSAASGATTATTDATVVVAKAVGTVAGTIKVVVNGSDAAAFSNGTATVGATISGSGLVSVNTNNNVTDTGTARSASVAANTAYVHVSADGSAGVGTITVTATDPNTGATVTVATKTVTFFGSLATLTATQNLSVASTAGADLGYSGTTSSSTNVPAVVLKAVDSAGNLVKGLTASNFGATSSDSTVMSATITATEDTNSAALNGPGYYNIKVTSIAAASGKSATLTFWYSTDSGVTKISTAPVTFTLGGTTIAAVKLTTDADSYAPGDKVTLSLVATDASGNPIADGVYGVFGNTSTTTALTPVSASAQLTSNPFSIASGSNNQYTFVGGKSSTTFYAPYTDGAVKLSGTLGTTNSGLTTALQGTTLAGTFTVATGASSSAQAAIDAAQEATDAANAAYDAANNAMDSADAATAAAQDASDNASAALAAVTSLSATVAKLVKSVAAIAAALAKVQKKIGA